RGRTRLLAYALWPPLYLRPLRPGLLGAAARWLPPGRPDDGDVRLPRRLPGTEAVVLADRPQLRDADLHAGHLRRPRARRQPDAGGGGARAGGGHRRRARRGAVARLGLARNRVL